MPRGSSAEVNDEFAWEAPPEQPYIDSKYQEQIDKVQKSPGRWGRLVVAPHAPYSQMQSVKKLTDRDERFETKVVRLSKTEYGLFLRYRSDEQMKAAKP